ncbi:MAG: glycosyltransferase family 2 protein [Chloroflexota bacterium]|nr:glycosyltransferase family 2 protein [Chloroflexota bacterium]
MALTSVRTTFRESLTSIRPTSVSAVQTTIVIPAYNEEEALPHVLKDIFTVIDDSYEVIVVDDGSRDNTGVAASTYPCRIISHDENRGKGAAMKTGLRHARGQNIIFIDGDATYPAAVIPEMVRHLDQCDFVRGARCDGRDNIPWINRIGNGLFDHLIRRLHQVDGSDLLTGLYGLKKQGIMAMRLESEGFDIESEIMIKARTLGLRTSTIPIQYRQRIGTKKLSPMKDGVRILKRVLALALFLNPFLTYALPGLILWSIALMGLLLLGDGPIMTAMTGLSTNTLIVSAMAFLTGFQMVVLGCVVNLYIVQSGLRAPSRILSVVAERFPCSAGSLFGAALILFGLGWSLSLAWGWGLNGFGPFNETTMLVMALALVVWGFQLLCTTIFLSLFAREATEKACT